MWYYDWQYKGHQLKFKNGTWNGVEYIYVDDQLASKKGSIMGSTHHFRIGLEEATLIIKVHPMTLSTVYLTFYVNNQLIFEKVEAHTIYGSSFQSRKNKSKIEGRKLLLQYDISQAKTMLHQALRDFPDDKESHFFLACCYSIEENTEECLKHLDVFLTAHPDKINDVKTSEFLAFIRMQEVFANKYS